MSDDGNKLFVAGVSWNTSDEAFSGFFSAFGVVKEAIVMREQNGRSRGFGFVTYDAHTSVKKVLSQQLQLDGRKLDIKPAVSKEDMSSNQAKPTTKKLYVAGVDYNTSDDALFNFFARFGEIEKAMIMKDKATGRSRGFGFVTFARETSVDEAVAAGGSSALQLEGRALDVKAAFPRGSAALMQGYQNLNEAGRPGSKKIFVAGLLTTTTDDSLRAHFENHGKVTDCYVQKNRATNESRGFGFVQFETEDEVAAVIKKDHSVDGKSVDVKVATPRPEKNAPGFLDYGNGNGMAYQQQMMPGMYGYGGRGGGRGGGFNQPGMQAMPSAMQQRAGAQGGGNAMAQGAMGMGMGMNAAMAMNAGGAMVTPQQAGMVGQQYAAGSQQGGNFAGEARYAGAYQPQGNVYSQANANAGFEVPEEGFANGGNPYKEYGGVGSYGAYGGRGGARSRNGAGFHPYSR